MSAFKKLQKRKKTFESVDREETYNIKAKLARIDDEDSSVSEDKQLKKDSEDSDSKS